MPKPVYENYLNLPVGASQIWHNIDMGGAPNTYDGYDLVVCCEQHERRKLTRPYGGEFIHVPMEDTTEFVIDGPAVDSAIDAIQTMYERGGRVLVHCTGGLNRSGVVMLRWLIDKQNLSPKGALALIRALRSRHALCNIQFERWATRETLPTVETSAFRTP